MAPSPTAVGNILRQVVHYHLDNGSYDNALFFAERLTAQDPRSSDTVYLFALCHLQLGDYRSAYDISKPMGYRGVNLGCAWVFAQASLRLERFKDGISALEKSKGLWSQKSTIWKHSATSRAAYPDAPAMLCLLGKLFRGYDDKKKAIGCFEEALKMNPFHWDAFTSLCELGAKLRVPNVFRANEPLLQALGQEAASAVATELKDTTVSIPPDVAPKKSSLRSITSELGSDPFNISFATDLSPLTDSLGGNGESDFMSKIQSARLRLANPNNNQPDIEGMETPTASSTSETMTARPGHAQEPPQAPARRTRNLQSIDPSQEAPPRMNYRLGTRRNAGTREKSHEQPVEPMPDVASTSNGAVRAVALSAGERKRTLSGHPVPRLTNVEEQTTRRSARLIKPSTRANAGGAPMGMPAGRELKKARPQVSRIIRPGSSGSNVGRVVSGNRKPLEDHHDVDHGEIPRIKEAVPPPQLPIPKVIEPDMAKLEESLKWTLDLLKKLANGFYLLSRFQCAESVQALSSLPPAHQSTPWVLAVMGRAHYEQTSYAEAEKFFRRMRVQAPSRLEDLEVYSTVLWHLKRETDLSFLAHELVDSAWHSPQAWCAVGNAWSLARDPEQALRCFKRATQLDPKFAYGFTLQGHEHVSNEEYDKALTAYRSAVSADVRHYNAYYGIGRVYQRLGDYEKALTHFQHALAVNPNNAVLVSCIGTVFEKQKHIVAALRAYSKAVELAPRAASTRYKKARALLAVGQIEEAQKELVILKDLAPDEGTVHFLLGTLYRSMNEKQLAVHHFTIALALDPKVSLDSNYYLL